MSLKIAARRAASQTQTGNVLSRHRPPTREMLHELADEVRNIADNPAALAQVQRGATCWWRSNVALVTWVAVMFLMAAIENTVEPEWLDGWVPTAVLGIFAIPVIYFAWRSNTLQEQEAPA